MNIDVEKLKTIIEGQLEDVNGIYYDSHGIIGVIDGNYIKISVLSREHVEDEGIDAPEKTDIVVSV